MQDSEHRDPGGAIQNAELLPVGLRSRLEEKSCFLGQQRFDRTLNFAEGRNYKIEVSRKGTVIVPTADGNIRRSEDGGETWDTVSISDAVSAGDSGSPVVDENTGDFLFVGRTGLDSPVDPADFCKGYRLTLFRSSDDGLNWRQEEGVLHLDDNGWLPKPINDKGMTLKYGRKAGRLLMPARVSVGYTNKGEGRRFFAKHYNTAVYSDDGGTTWWPSAPFPESGTGEGTLAELSDGRIYYNSRSHIAEDAQRRIAWSYDAGETWTDLSVSVLPDRSGGHDGGNQAYGCKGGLVRLPFESEDILLYSHPDIPINHDRRCNVSVWASFDGGASWPVKRSIYSENGGYSMLAAGRPGTPSEGWIYIVFIDRNRALQHYARFNLSWVLGGELTGLAGS